MGEVAPSGIQDIDGILWGYKWDTLNLTYSTPTSPAEYSGYQTITNFEAMNVAQSAAIDRVMTNFSNVCGLNITHTNGAGANIRFAEVDQLDTGQLGALHTVSTAEGIPPDPNFDSNAWGDTWYNHNNYNNPALGSFAYAAGFMHEVGHALGLKHGHTSQDGHGVTFPTLPFDHNSYEYSVMTYSQYVGDNNSGDNAPHHPTSLMMDDIAALQYMYGADNAYNAGNTTYSFSTTTGEMFINGAGQGAAIANYIMLTIWDGGGIDTYDFSNYSTNVSVNLLPGSYSTPSNAQLANLGDGHFARGSIFNAYENGSSLIENATGGSGADSIYGNNAANVLIGNGGNDGINGVGGNDVILGGAGNDTLLGGDGNDAINGGTENDNILCGNGDDIAFGGAGNDAILGEAGNDVLWGEDNAAATAGNDQIDGGDGNDTILGQGGNDVLVGGSGNDAINGGDGVDVLYGGNEADVIFGGLGGDLIYGGAGGDVLKGEGGNDLFSFNAGDNADDILDWNAEGGRDGIDLRSVYDAGGYNGYTAVADGVLAIYQNGAASDIYVFGHFMVRLENVTAAALIQDQSWVLIQ